MDIMLDMAKGQGYVPKECELDGQLVMGFINSGKDPCIGCNEDRNKCNGRPKVKRINKNNYRGRV